MENQPNTKPPTDFTTTPRQKNEIRLPLIALGLVLASILVILLFEYLQLYLYMTLSFILLMALLLQIAGFVAGVASLRRGKKRIGLAGKIIAIVAIVVPLIPIAFIIIFSIGLTTGVISGM
jgi:hypothetical protein